MTMKKKVLFILVIIPTLLINSCNDKEIESFIEETTIAYFGLEVKDVVPLPKGFLKYTEHLASCNKSVGLIPVLSESVLVSYQNFPVQAIVTPLNSLHKSSTEKYHVYFELDGRVSKYDLIINIEPINEFEVRYLYQTNNGSFLFSFDVTLANGLINNIQKGQLLSLKSTWWGRWKSCVAAVLDAMIDEPAAGLICMAYGKICAPSIAALCAIGATEGYEFNNHDF